jgi:hypothetical protein
MIDFNFSSTEKLLNELAKHGLFDPTIADLAKEFIPSAVDTIEELANFMVDLKAAAIKRLIINHGFSAKEAISIVNGIQLPNIK